MRVVYLEGRGFLIPLRILSILIGELLAQSVTDLGEEGAVVVGIKCVDSDEGEDASDDSSPCCPPGIASLIGMIRAA